MRVGHTRLIHVYLIARENTPIWEVSGVKLKVRYIVTECMKYERDRHTIEMDESFDSKLKTM